MKRLALLLLTLAALVAVAVLRREPVPTADLWDEPGGGW